MKSIPETLRKFLTELTDAQADEIWLYLDETVNVESDLIEFIIKTHPKLENSL